MAIRAEHCTTSWWKQYMSNTLPAYFTHISMTTVRTCFSLRSTITWFFIPDNFLCCWAQVAHMSPSQSLQKLTAAFNRPSRSHGRYGLDINRSVICSELSRASLSPVVTVSELSSSLSSSCVCTCWTVPSSFSACVLSVPSESDRVAASPRFFSEIGDGTLPPLGVFSAAPLGPEEPLRALLAPRGSLVAVWLMTGCVLPVRGFGARTPFLFFSDIVVMMFN